MTRPTSQAGLTLVELMIALTLGLIVIGALVAVFVANSRNYRQNDALSSVQDNARYALDVMGRDLAMAGYWGGVRPQDATSNLRLSVIAAAAVSNSALPGDCGPSSPPAGTAWLFDVSQPIGFRDHQASGAVTDLFRCLTNVAANTDIVMIRRAAGVMALNLPLGSANDLRLLTAGRFYLKTNASIGTLFRADASNTNPALPADCPDASGTNAPCPPTSAPMQLYAYTPHLYYVRNYRRTVGDGETTLCRRFLNDTLATPIMDEECLADGVENLQIEWGLDTSVSNPNNTTPYSYVRAPTTDQMDSLATARIYLLVRAPIKNVGLSPDAKSYNFAGYNSANDPAFPQTGYVRRLFSTTVQLKGLRPQ